MLFHHYGFKETLYYTVTFGVSRGLGPLAQLIWDRALGLPIERPESVSLEYIKNQFHALADPISKPKGRILTTRTEERSIRDEGSLNEQEKV